MKLLQGFERRDAPESFFRAYSAPFATPADCNGVIAFPKSIAMKTFKAEKGTPEDQAAVRRKPAIMIEGMRDKVLLAKYFVPVFKTTFPNAPIHYLENASHFCLEDAPEEISRLILDFIAINSTGYTLKPAFRLKVQSNEISKHLLVDPS
jgi:cis-3-alkyl-4-acyloxetan-2-one decarboxylase